MGEKTGVLVVRFKKVQPPPVEKSSIPAIVPQAAELPSRRPDFEPPPPPEKKQPQTVTYESQELSMDQVIYLLTSLGLNSVLSHSLG